MLLRLFKNLLGRRRSASHDQAMPGGPLRLHVGGKIAHPDWKILNVVSGPDVDYVGNCMDLSRFADASVTAIYASHVLEHLSYQSELSLALCEFRRVLIPHGTLYASVPDLMTLCALYQKPNRSAEERLHLMRMMFGGQLDAADFHYVGLDYNVFTMYLSAAGFTGIERVDDFGLFDDTSRFTVEGTPISLNVRAYKPG